MLLVGRAVTNALERTISIRRARFVPVGTDSVASVLVLPGCPTRLTHAYK